MARIYKAKEAGTNQGRIGDSGMSRWVIWPDELPGLAESREMGLNWRNRVNVDEDLIKFGDCLSKGKLPDGQIIL